MAFLTTNAFCIPVMAASAPPRSCIIVSRAAAKSTELPSKAVGSYGGGQRRAMVLFTGAVTASSSAVSRCTRADAVATTGLGQWEDIEDVTNPYVQGLGYWAVTEHHRQTGDNLQFVAVVAGQLQVVAGGTNYRLQIEAKGPHGLHTYVAVVFDPLMTTPPQERQLTSFTPLVG
ncbi:hypothetical protein BS78_05G103300 [Paspalum vaginatum]|nr:hypothetical protein BS78_05G103300 [Paspalum vaginatum]